MRRQKRHKFLLKIFKDKEVFTALWKLFNGKCAYCETKLDSPSAAEVDQFRPKAGSYDIHTKLSLDHYWWLAYDWRNLYLVCQICNANKGSKFPVSGRRVKVPKGDLAQHNAKWFWEDLAMETPLLLDPCSVNPDDHLLFRDSGLVHGLTREGKVTIETLKLNRERLVHERSRAVEETIYKLQRARRFLGESAESRITDTVRQLLSPSAPYLGLRRACINSWLRTRMRFTPSKILRITKVDEGAATRISAAAEATLVKKSVIAQEKREKARAAIDKLEAQYITKIELHNVKAIEHLEIELTSPEENNTPWLVLLGENGMGKSSILKAVALALMDMEYCRGLKIDASKFVRYGQRSGYVRVHTTAHSKPFEIKFYRGPKNFRKGERQSTPNHLARVRWDAIVTARPT